MPYKVWVAGEECLSADFNPYVQEQVVATFATAAARTTALPAPKPGQMTWRNDGKVLEVYDGTAWQRASPAAPLPVHHAIAGVIGSGVWVDISGGALAISSNAVQTYRIDALFSIYSVQASVPFSMRAYRDPTGGVGTGTALANGGQPGARLITDLLTMPAMWIDPNVPAGAHTYRIEGNLNGATAAAGGYWIVTAI